MRFTILNYGTMQLPKNMLIDGETTDFWPIPIWGILMQSEGRNIIFDLGCMKDAMQEGHWSTFQQERDPYEENPEGIDGMLAKVGLTRADIDTVIVSHLHSDHFGLISEFPHVEAYVPEEEWVVAMKRAFGTSAVREDPTGPYYFRTMSSPVKKYNFVKIGEDQEVCEGLRIITLPGHTPNLLAILVTVDSGEKYLFPSDAVYTPINAGPPIHLPGVLSNAEAYRSSMERAIEIAKAEGAHLMYSHWMPFFDTLKKCPEWYE